MARRVEPYLPELVIALCALGLAFTFAHAVLRHTRPFGLPFEDAYIYLTYAKQFGRGEPFTYYSGGGYSAGSTSVLWPMLLAPFWTLGARGHALVWVSFGLCTALYAATCVACYRLLHDLGGKVVGLAGAVLVLAIAPFAFTSLSGMEVGFASALLLVAILLLLRAPSDGPPSRGLGVTLAALSLSRPEATMIVAGIVAISVASRLRQRDLRAAAWWAAPMLAPLLWVTANKLFAGNWFPNTGVAKSHFYLPGFDWTYWWDAVTTQTGRMLRGLFSAGDSPLVWPRVIAALWLVGAVRVLVWARRTRRWLVGLLIVGSPPALVLAVIASSGAWSFHNYRYIAPAFPLLVVTAACALLPVPLPETWRYRRWFRAGWSVATLALAGAFAYAGLPGIRADLALFAQNAADLNRQVVTLGRYVHDKLPEASIMFHDAGAVAYYGDRPVYDMLGLVTNRQADVANHGPGARFEFLESLPPERRPTHFVYYPGWMGQHEFFGRVVLQTPLGRPFHRRRLVGGYDMQLIEATWDHVHTAERPLEPVPGWRVVDRVDIADRASERAHGWSGALGRRAFADPTAKWSVFHRDVRVTGLALDGGRSIRGRTERFTITVDPARPVRLVLRTGGEPSYRHHPAIQRPVEVVVSGPAGELARAQLPPPTGPFVEVAFDLRLDAPVVTLETKATGAYRVFHYFVLQPE